MHPENVPYFVYPRDGWMDRVRAFFKKRGYEVHWTWCKYGSNFFKIPKRGMHIVCGDSLSWKTASHVVVYKNGKLAYDPNYPSKWSEKRVTHRLIVKRIRK